MRVGPALEAIEFARRHQVEAYAIDHTTFFNIPTERVMEIGSQVQMADCWPDAT
ncbi:MAG: hypothetical protein R3B07_26450 [Polyangiaceae bacterium]